MKKHLLILATISVLFLISCDNKQPQEEDTRPETTSEVPVQVESGAPSLVTE